MRFIRVLTHLISLISFIPLYVGLQVKRLLILCRNSILEMIFLPPVMNLTLNLLCLDYSVIKKQIECWSSVAFLPTCTFKMSKT